MAPLCFQAVLLAISAAASASWCGSGLYLQTLATSAGVPPSRDPFYTVPEGLDELEPGTILRHRTPPFPIASFSRRLHNIQDSHQILYRTTNHQGNATTTIITVLIPYNADYNKVLSFQAAEDAANIDCAPSYGFQLHPKPDPLLRSPIMEFQLRLMQASLTRGWIIISADAEGPTGTYPPDTSAGFATLDGLRAALRSTAFTGIQKKPRTVLWGYSAGATTTKLAVGIQPAYAPELEIAGAAVGGLASHTGHWDAAHSFSQFNKGSHSWIIPVTLLGLAAQIPEVERLIDGSLKPEWREIFYAARKQCLDANKDTFAYADVLAMFKDTSFLQNLSSLGPSNRRNAIPRIPLFWYQYASDDLATLEEVDSAISNYCALGATIKYLVEYAPNLSHFLYAAVGAASALGWLEDVLNGTDPEPGCTRSSTLTTEMYRSFLYTLPEPVSILIMFAGIKSI